MKNGIGQRLLILSFGICLYFGPAIVFLNYYHNWNAATTWLWIGWSLVIAAMIFLTYEK